MFPRKKVFHGKLNDENTLLTQWGFLFYFSKKHRVHNMMTRVSLRWGPRHMPTFAESTWGRLEAVGVQPIVGCHLFTFQISSRALDYIFRSLSILLFIYLTGLFIRMIDFWDLHSELFTDLCRFGIWRSWRKGRFEEMKEQGI